MLYGHRQHIGSATRQFMLQVSKQSTAVCVRRAVQHVGTTEIKCFSPGKPPNSAPGVCRSTQLVGRRTMAAFGSCRLTRPWTCYTRVLQTILAFQACGVSHLGLEQTATPSWCSPLPLAAAPWPLVRDPSLQKYLLCCAVLVTAILLDARSLHVLASSNPNM